MTRAPIGLGAPGSGLRAPNWALCLVLWAVGLGPAPAAAQQPVQFLPRFDFHLAAEHLSDDDPRFAWDADFGGEVDVVDYRAGRVTFTANYEVVMGDQFRRFDPNQGNYILAGSASARAGEIEVAGNVLPSVAPPQRSAENSAPSTGTWSAYARRRRHDARAH